MKHTNQSPVLEFAYNIFVAKGSRPRRASVWYILYQSLADSTSLVAEWLAVAPYGITTDMHLDRLVK